MNFSDVEMQLCNPTINIARHSECRELRHLVSHKTTRYAFEKVTIPKLIRMLSSKLVSASVLQ